MKGRHIQRGKSLLPMCYKAKISKYEHGPNDDKLYCYALTDDYGEDAHEECQKCKAWAHNL